MDWLMLVLRIIHIGNAVFWAGGVFITSMVLLPTVQAIGPAGGTFMREFVGVRKFPVRVMVSALLTIGSGLWLYYLDNSRSAGSFASSRQGMTYGVGAVFALVTLVPGLAIMKPASAKIVALGDTIRAGGGPSTPEQTAEMARLQARMRMGARAATITLGISLLSMAIGRYV
jgi:uncharacterized membrane protein